MLNVAGKWPEAYRDCLNYVGKQQLVHQRRKFNVRSAVYEWAINTGSYIISRSLLLLSHKVCQLTHGMNRTSKRQVEYTRKFGTSQSLGHTSKNAVDKAGWATKSSFGSLGSLQLLQRLSVLLRAEKMHEILHVWINWASITYMNRRVKGRIWIN